MFKLLRSLLFAFLLCTSAFAQPDNTIDDLTLNPYDAYAGAHVINIYILPFLGAQVGARSLLAPNVGVRLDLETPLPYVVIGILGVGLNLTYHYQLEESNVAIYGGVGPRTILGFSEGASGALFGVGGLVGLEFELTSASLYAEIEENVLLDGQSAYPTIPVFRFGFNIPLE